MDETKKMPYALWEGTKVYLIIPGFDPKKELTLTEKTLKGTGDALWLCKKNTNDDFLVLMGDDLYWKNDIKIFG